VREPLVELILPVTLGLIFAVVDLAMISVGWFADPLGWTGAVSALSGMILGYAILIRRAARS
jgi:hypothetical protein